MSLRAAPPNRPAVEADLPPEAREFLDWFRSRFALGPNWAAVKAVEEIMTTLALEERAEELERVEGLSAKQARERAGARQGVVPDTVRTRLNRWITASWKPCVSLNAENDG